MTGFGFRALLVLAICVVAEPAWAATKAIGRIESDSLKLLVVESDTGVSLALSSSTKLQPQDASISYTAEPARIIIDIPLVKKSKNTDKLELQHAFLKGVRIGAHPEKTRIVVDLRQPITLRHSVGRVESLGALLIHLHKESQQRVEPVASQEAPALVIKEDPIQAEQARKAAREREAVLAARSKLARAGAVLTADGVIVHKGNPEEKAEVVSAIPELRGVRFIEDRESGLEALALEITESKGYSLRALGSGEYEVRIRAARIEAALPSSPGLGFEQLALGQEGADAVLRIRVKRGLALGATQSERGLELRLSRE